VILGAWRRGARFDAWSEALDVRRWWEAFAEQGLDPAFYAHRERPLEEILPWDHIHAGVSKEYLMGEYQRSLHEETTLDCREGPCRACGILETFPRETKVMRDGGWGCVRLEKEPTASSSPEGAPS
jgi:hypothetical protein